MADTTEQTTTIRPGFNAFRSDDFSKNPDKYLIAKEMTERGMVSALPLKQILVPKIQTDFQSCQVVESYAFGKTLMLDGMVQSSLVDECIYHESLVQPALHFIPEAAKSVFIGGGGELATAREVMKHKSVERCLMVDIDEKVVNFCEEHLPEWGQNVRANPKFEVLFADAKKHLEDTKETFDVIIMDINDPEDGGPGTTLYTIEMYQTILSKLNPGGVFVTQAGSASIETCQMSWTAVGSTLRQVFGKTNVQSYAVCIPSFFCEWGFHLCFKSDEPLAKPVEEYNQTAVDALIEDRLGEANLRYYDGHSHQILFHLNKITRRQLLADSRVITMENVATMYPM